MYLSIFHKNIHHQILDNLLPVCYPSTFKVPTAMAASQNTAALLKTQDLQIAKGTSSFSMIHKMGLVDISVTSSGRLSASDIVNTVNVRMTDINNTRPYLNNIGSVAHAYAISDIQSVNGYYATISTDEQTKKYSGSFSVTSGKVNSFNTTYDVKIPIDYVAIGNIQSNTKNSSGQWIINTANNTTSSGYYWFGRDNFSTYFGDFTKGMTCSDGKKYHVATKQEYVSIVPCISSGTVSNLYDWDGAKTETEVRFGGMTTDHSYTSYWSRGSTNVIYGIRFVGTIYCSAWRYEWSTDSSIGGGGEIVKVKYLGRSITTSNATSTLKSSKSYNWNASDIIIRKFPATGFAVTEGTSASKEFNKRVRHIAATYVGYNTTYNRDIWWELMFGFYDSGGYPFAWVEDLNGWHSGTNDPRTVRLFLDENQ